LNEKFSFAIIDKCISFSPKTPYKLAAERSEADNLRLQNPFWRCILEIARTEFCSRRAERGSGVGGGQNVRLRRARSKLPKNLKTNRLEPYFVRAKENFS
jgi:hypothetical protein